LTSRERFPEFPVPENGAQYQQQGQSSHAPAASLLEAVAIEIAGGAWLALALLLILRSIFGNWKFGKRSLDVKAS